MGVCGDGFPMTKVAFQNPIPPTDCYGCRTLDEVCHGVFKNPKESEGK